MTIQVMMFGGTNPVTYTGLVNSLYQTGVSMSAAGIAYYSNDIYASTQDNTNFTVPVVRISSTGTITWQRKLSLTGATGVSAYGSDLVAGNLAADSSGNLYVVGAFTNSGGTADGFLIKYNASGTIQWQRKINAAGTTSIGNVRVAIDSTGTNIYVSSVWTKSSATASSVLQYNNSGVLQNQRMLYTGGFNNVGASAIAVDSSGNVFVGGQTLGTRAFIVKYNSTLTLQWQQYVTGAVAPNIQYIDFDNSGNIYLSGTPRIFKLNSSGTVQWGYTFSTNNVSAYGIAVDPTTGNSWGSYNNGSNAFTFNQFDSSGNNTYTNNIGITGGSPNIPVGGKLGATGYYIFAANTFITSSSTYVANFWRMPTNMGNTGGGSVSLTNWTQSSYTVGTANSTASASLSSGTEVITEAIGTYVDAAGAFTDAAGTLSIASGTF